MPEDMVYPHSFRHLFAKEYIRKIGDISELADLLGHSRLETTWIYSTAKELENFYISGGRIGTQIKLSPIELVKSINGKFDNITAE